ncbi:hypothetical protein TW95_gp0223 [Pandoravirus inopinatum]|uniref:Uncharacterized protein n=1 Tax=Pandoravirus inopinatum TaxID=1605721 RepID=A0A0B5JBL8_9VIRU|nr:hypothetical protein TW95_gp0223 [Pandoravirus inopinatum]AJF96957.1 hypothetical protein [Pandoravirus inopinatum]
MATVTPLLSDSTAPVASTHATPTAGTVATPAPVRAAESDPSPVSPASVAKSMTITDLCKFLRALPDPKAPIHGASEIKTMPITFALVDGTVTQAEAWGDSFNIADFKPKYIDHNLAISFNGDSVPADVLLAAMEPCLAKHAHVRVCVNRRRAVVGKPPAVAIPVDCLPFKKDPTTMADLAMTREALRVAESLAAMGTYDGRVIAATGSTLMPRHWEETRFFVDGTLLQSLSECLPNLHNHDMLTLFVAVGPTHDEAAEKGHGRLIIRMPIPGLTYAMLVDAYGRSCLGCPLSSISRTWRLPTLRPRPQSRRRPKYPGVFHARMPLSRRCSSRACFSFFFACIRSLLVHAKNAMQYLLFFPF